MPKNQKIDIAREINTSVCMIFIISANLGMTLHSYWSFAILYWMTKCCKSLTCNHLLYIYCQNKKRDMNYNKNIIFITVQYKLLVLLCIFAVTMGPTVQLFYHTTFIGYRPYIRIKSKLSARGGFNTQKYIHVIF